MCANLYFPFREDHETLVGFLRNHVSPVIDTVNCIELEWAEESPLDPTTLLGEPHGQRGKNQTSPDIAFIVNGGKGIVLTESKFTEHSFYPCSGRKTIYGNPDIGRCLNLREEAFNNLVEDFEKKLQGYDEVWFYYNPGRFHKVYRRLIEAVNSRQKLKQKIEEFSCVYDIE